MKTCKIVILLFFVQLVFGSNLFAKTVVVYGLKAMPFCTTINGHPSGIAVDILNESTKYGAPNFTFNFELPWKRAQYVVQKPDAGLVAIIPFSRTQPREDNFKWVSELVKTQYRFYSYGRTSPIKSIDEIKDKKIGVVFGHAIISKLKGLGFQKIDDGAKDAAINALKLKRKRFDVIADSDIISLYHWKKLGEDTKKLQPGPVIGDIVRVYIATGLDFPDDVAKSISDAIEKMRNNGKLQEIIDKWLHSK